MRHWPKIPDTYWGGNPLEPKRYIFLRRRSALGARLLGVVVAVVLVGLPAELERGVAAEPEAGQEGAAVWVAAVDGPMRAPAAQVRSASLTSPTAPALRPFGYAPDELQAFAASAYQMIVIRERWRPVLERAAAASADEAAKARHAQAIELAQAVRERGLTTARYREIFNTAQRAPAFKAYLLTLVRQADNTAFTN
jgi:hypothetical protein